MKMSTENTSAYQPTKAELESDFVEFMAVSGSMITYRKHAIGGFIDTSTSQFKNSSTIQGLLKDDFNVSQPEFLRVKAIILQSNM
jgi:hypothetical protein